MQKRSSVFTYSDVHSAAEEFVETIAEHADVVWEPDDIDALAQSLTERAFTVLREPGAMF